MNVIFTCGGTAGHVNPALALQSMGICSSRYFFKTFRLSSCV